jgi:hypothetical protein
MRVMRFLSFGLVLAFFGVAGPAVQAAPALVLTRAHHPGPDKRATIARGLPGLTPYQARVMIGQVPLDRARARLEAAAVALPRSAADGLGGTWVSGATHVLTVYWKGALPGSVRQLLAGLSSPLVRVRVAPARYTFAYLDARAAELVKIKGVLAAGIRPDGGGLIGWLSPSAHAALTRMTSELHGVPLVTHYGRPNSPAVHTQRAAVKTLSLPTSGRLADFAPHWAGARIEGCQQSGITESCDDCTSGFPMKRNSDGRTFIPTAAHCFGWLLRINGSTVESWWAPGYGSSTDPNANPTYKFGDTWYNYGSLDTKIIRSTSVQGETYDHGVREGTETWKPVVGTQGNGGGDSVCESGAGGGVFCGITVNYPATFPGTNIHGWEATGSARVTDTNGVSHNMAGCDGDSGGPVFSLNTNPGQVLAKGLIKGSLTASFNWTNNNNETRSCAGDLFYIDIQNILDQLGASIVTG